MEEPRLWGSDIFRSLLTRIQDYGYAAVTGEGHRASDCIGCKQCERACPQHLPITKYLGQCAQMLEK